MTSRRAGAEGSKPPSPSSSGSEDNGFVNRPRVAGLYLNNLSSDDLARSDVPGTSGKLTGGDVILSSSSSSSSFSTSSPLSTPPSSSAALGSSRLGQSARIISWTGGARRRRCWEGDDRDTRSRIDEESSTRHSDDSSRLSQVSPSGYEVFDQDDSSERTIRQFGNDDSVPDIGLDGDGGGDSVSIGGRSNMGEASMSDMFPRCNPRSFDDNNEEDDDPRGIADDDDDEHQQQEEEEEEEADEDMQREKMRFRSQDSTRLRPPLVGTAGTSADSGTGDSASAEIQADTLGTPQQPLADDILEDKCDDDRESPGSLERRMGAISGQGSVSGQGTKSTKHSVKPFTKESLDRLETRTVQLVRDYGFQPKRKTSVEDGAILPHKFEPFPSNLYGRPLEEIDNFIYDEVSCVFEDFYEKHLVDFY